MVSDVVPQVPEVGHGFVVLADLVGERAGWLAGAFLAALIVWGVSAAWWRRRAEGELGRRARFELVPAVTFDPKLGDVGQAAARLGEARSAAGGVPRRAAALRVRVRAGAESRLHYGWEGPQQASSVLRMPGYRQVEVRPAGAVRDAAARVRFEGVAPLEQGSGW